MDGFYFALEGRWYGIMEFSNAFDPVSHNRRLNKLNRCGVRNKTHIWIFNFFYYRKQKVVIGENTSTKGQARYSNLYFSLFTYMIDYTNSIHQFTR